MAKKFNDINSSTFLSLMRDSTEKVEKMLKTGKAEVSCWICGKTEGTKFYGLESKQSTEKFVAFSGKAIEFTTKMTGMTLKRRKAEDLRVPICRVCQYLIIEITKHPKYAMEVKEVDLSYI